MTLRRTTAIVSVVTLLTGSIVVLPGCTRKGPAQRAGENIDRAVEDVKDTLDPPGPAEKAGRKIDRAVDDLTK